MYDWLFVSRNNVVVSAGDFTLPIVSENNNLTYRHMYDWPIAKVFNALNPQVKLREVFLLSELMQVTKLSEVVMTDDCFEKFIKQCRNSPGCGGKSLSILRLTLADIKTKHAQGS